MSRDAVRRICISIGIGVAILVAASVLFADEVSKADLKTTDGLLELIRDDSAEYLLVDVRTDGEYVSGHIPTAVNIPYQNIVRDLPDGPKDRLIIVYCRSGSRSGRAERWLRQAGYTSVVDFGGILSWRGPVVHGRSPGDAEE